MLLFCFLYALTFQAQALQCSASVSAVDFGQVDVTSHVPITSTSTLSISCQGQAGSVVTLCPHIGAGSGGSEANGLPRTLSNGAQPLDYNLYKDAARTQIWGSAYAGWSGVSPPTLQMTLNGSGAGQLHHTLWGQLEPQQKTAPVGDYTSHFAGAESQLVYAYGQTSCDMMHGAITTTPASFQVRAKVIPRCTVQATSLDFGQTGFLDTFKDATNTINVVCTTAAAYSLSLGQGLAEATSPTERFMTHQQYRLRYGLYRDAARTQPWGWEPEDRLIGVGTGATQRYRAFGRIPAQTTPPPGSYSDTVVVTVSY